MKKPVLIALTFVLLLFGCRKDEHLRNFFFSGDCARMADNLDNFINHQIDWQNVNWATSLGGYLLEKEIGTSAEPAINKSHYVQLEFKTRTQAGWIRCIIKDNLTDHLKTGRFYRFSLQQYPLYSMELSGYFVFSKPEDMVVFTCN